MARHHDVEELWDSVSVLTRRDGILCSTHRISLRSRARDCAELSLRARSAPRAIDAADTSIKVRCLARTYGARHGTCADRLRSAQSRARSRRRGRPCLLAVSCPPLAPLVSKSALVRCAFLLRLRSRSCGGTCLARSLALGFGASSSSGITSSTLRARSFASWSRSMGPRTRGVSARMLSAIGSSRRWGGARFASRMRSSASIAPPSLRVSRRPAR